MKGLLHIKHWQLFLLTVGVPMLMQIVLVILAIAGFGSEVMMIILMLIVAVYCPAIFFGWMYTTVTHLNHRLPDTVAMNLKRFEFFFFTPFVYVLVLSISLMSMQEVPPVAFLLIVPAHLFCMFCMFYCLYFFAKSLKAVELQRDVTSSDYLDIFFLIWFFPIGLWMIQPRINRIFAAENNVAINY